MNIMGRGRKAKASRQKEIVLPSWSVNSSITARNLVKKDLGGVIFGCKNNTIAECYSKQLFGLPASHFSYIRNINPGMTLFLFNYSDRKLHGIFEAASPGQMNINPYGWTPDGSELTPYAAQVRIQIRMHCHPLLEGQFKPIISKNYYEEKLFWFELDRAQTSKLVSLFSSSPVPGSTSFLEKTVKWSTTLKALPTGTASGTNHDGEVDDGHLGASNTEWGASWSIHGTEEETGKKRLQDVVCSNPNQWPSHSSLERTLPQKKWSALFQQSPIPQSMNGDEEVLLPEMYFKNPDSEELLWEVPTDVGVANNEEDENFEEVKLLEANLSSSPEMSLARNESGSSSVDRASEMISSDLQTAVSELTQGVEHMKHSQLIQKVSSLEQELATSKREIQKLEARCKMLESGSCSSIGVARAQESKFCSESQSSLEDSILLAGGFDGSSWLSNLDSYSLSMDLIKSLTPMAFVRSYASTTKLDGELYVVGGCDGNSWYNTVESYNPMTNQWGSCPSLTQSKGSLAGVSLKDNIFAVGGGDGQKCFSEVEVLDPNAGRWIFAQSMQQKRFALAATELNGALYAVGGYDGEDYLKSVERFDPRVRWWTRLENMNSRRGCHCVAVLNEKLYALGGYDGTNMAATVEVFDPRIGLWMPSESMNYPKGYFGAVVIGDSIYAIGGLQDNGRILNTVERYKEGHGWEVTSLKAVGKRCFFSASVL